jgi:hypothetical protein
MKRKILITCCGVALLWGIFGFGYGLSNFLFSSNNATLHASGTAVNGIPDSGSPATVSGAATGSGGGFIATAAFGSYLDPHVIVLRNFRDRFLLTNRPGKALVDFYYKTSPPLAEVIAGKEGIKKVVRIGLLPIIGFAALALKLGLLWASLLVVVILVAGAIFLRKLRRRSHREQTYFHPSMPGKLSSLIQAGRLQ